MAGSTNIGWQLFGTLLCGIVFAIPIILGYYIVRGIMQRVEKGKARREKEQTVV